MNTVTIVVPCWNEAARLRVGDFLDAIKAYPQLTFVFVDDGSTDATAETLAFLARESPAIKALYLNKNSGKAEAVRTGVNWALENTTCEAVGFWDADLATPLEELPRFMTELERDRSREIVIGARWPHLGARIDRSTFRTLTGEIMKFLIRLAIGVHVFDTQCGAKLFRRETARELFAQPFISRWLFDVELLVRLGPSRLKRHGVELPLANWMDVPGSKLRSTELPRLLGDLIRIRREKFQARLSRHVGHDETALGAMPYAS